MDFNPKIHQLVTPDWADYRYSVAKGTNSMGAVTYFIFDADTFKVLDDLGSNSTYEKAWDRADYRETKTETTVSVDTHRTFSISPLGTTDWHYVTTVVTKISDRNGVWRDVASYTMPTEPTTGYYGQRIEHSRGPWVG